MDWHQQTHFQTHCLHLELDQHALTAHTSRAPQVVDVLIFLIQLPSAHRLFTGAVITYEVSAVNFMLPVNIEFMENEKACDISYAVKTTHPREQSCFQEAPGAS